MVGHTCNPLWASDGSWVQGQPGFT
jgi:hypothetical protein